jgi:protein gp37
MYLRSLLGFIDLSPWMCALDWVITGDEIGAGGIEADPRDVRAVFYPYLAAGVPLYFKQWGGRHNKALKNTLAGEKWAQLGGYISHNACR